MKLAHISDIHLDTAHRPSCIAEIDDLIRRIFDKGFDHLVMTGDIVDVANFDDLYRLRDVLAKNNVLSWEKITIIPGNHDIFGKYEFSGDGLRETLVRAVQATGMSYLKKLHNFCDIFRETITSDAQISTYFPFIKILDGATSGVAIVSFNSVLEWSARRNPAGSRGYIHATERYAVEQPEILAALHDKFVVALCHHAFRIYEPSNALDQAFLWSMELMEREAYLKTLKKIGAKIALHGHYHKAEDYRIDGVHFINSGSVRRAGIKFNAVTIHADGSYDNDFVKV